MADRPVGIENMAVSSDLSACHSQQNLKDSGKEEVEPKGGQNNPKSDAPKKKTTFKITSITKSSQRGGSGDLTQDNDLDSQDDLDETVDSHTEDLSSEIYDTNSKATDIDSQDPLLTPEEVLIKEKPARFKVVKVETKEPFKRGRWICYDYLDVPDKTEAKQDEININSGSSSAANSVHYVHGVDDPSKNPLIAGATGTIPSQPHTSNVADGSNSTNALGEVFQPIQPAPSSQYGVTPVNQTNASFSNHVAQPSGAYNATPGQSGTLSLPVMPGPSNSSLKGLSSAPNLPHPQPGQAMPGQNVGVSVAGGQGHQQPPPQGSTIPANLHSQQAAGSSNAQQTTSGAMQTGEYVNSSGQGQAMAGAGQQVSGGQQQQGMYDMSSQQPGYNLNAVAVGNVSGNPQVPQQNNLPTPSSSQPPEGYSSDVEAKLSTSTITNHNRRDQANITPTMGAGLAPLEIAVGGITNHPGDDDMTEEAFLDYFSNLSTYGGSGLFPPLMDESGGSSTVAIDNKIEQAMDLVKSHLMYAVREEVEVLKEQIKELMERMRTVEYENKVLRSEASPETLAKLPAPLPPLQNPLLQQFMTAQPPSSSS
ncbi:hypothetical protein V1264_010780 [Littorina saxatilis]|uniref:Uncharacterized protein n=2 Tax=Littorina saxatilis TaxID=31220 RepID=A0AAN9AQB6_9CAEN